MKNDNNVCKTHFRAKSFTSFFLFFSFLISVLSGLGLYLSPRGRIAHWIHWDFLGFTKTDWEAIHIVFVAVFLIASLFHLFWFNWKTFWCYIRTKSTHGIRYGWELLASVVLAVLLFFGVYYRVPPVYSLVDLATWIDNSYEVQRNQPPVPHTEELSLRQVARQVLNCDVDDLLSRLETAGYPALRASEKVQDLAERHGITPRQVLDILESETISETGVNSEISHVVDDSHAGLPSSGGLGRKTIRDLAREYIISVDDASEALEDAGIQGAVAGDYVRDLASQHNKRPSEIALVLWEISPDR